MSTARKDTQGFLEGAPRPMEAIWARIVLFIYHKY
jgi:hypothetical protein